MKSTILSTLFAAFAFSATSTYAQNATVISKSDSGSNRTISVGVTVGTSGIGIDTRTPLNKDFNLRFGASVLACNCGQLFGINGGLSSTEGSAMLNMTKFQMLLEYRLLPDVRLVGGAGFFYQSGIVADGKYLNSMKSAGLDMKDNEVNMFKVGILWKNINPYMGVSLLRDRPVGRFNINMDLGVYYLSAPKSKWQYDAGKNEAEVKANVERYKQVLDDHLSKYRWLPVVQINFNYMAVKKLNRRNTAARGAHFINNI